MIGPRIGRNEVAETNTGERNMALALHHKRALFWSLGIITLFVLSNLAWTQIASAFGHCIFTR
jgi:hypothetical protein